jgi:hypothetical protein
MKIRTGFVSNSSTSSFVCSACGCIEAGRDISIDEVEMLHCINGHYVHESCADNPDLEPFLKQYTIEYVEKYGDPDYEEEELQDEARSEGKYEIPEEHCPICSFEKLSKEDELAYYRWKMDFNKEDVLKSISEEFKSYKEFKDKIYQ